MDPYELQFTPRDVARTLAEWRERIQNDPSFYQWYGSIIGHEILSTADCLFGLEGVCLDNGRRQYTVADPLQLAIIDATFKAAQQYTAATKAAIFPEKGEASVDELAAKFHAALQDIAMPLTPRLHAIGPLKECTENLCKEGDLSVRKLVYAANRFFNPHVRHSQHYLKEDILSFIERMFDVLKEKDVHIGCEGVRPLLTTAPYFDEAVAPLIWNAIDHACIKGEELWISIETKPEFLDEKRYRVKAPGTYTVRVTDTGRGIAQATLERIFEKGFTTREEREGHGLGLYGVKQFVESRDGTIEAQSEIGKGTTFTIAIPYQRAELNLCIQE